uniref:hypothetical protein n=1 Tax=Jiella sp. LLJ827 TaxID=2917712 RepID=UPI00350E3AF9
MPHYPLYDSILATEVQSVRAFGSDSDSDSDSEMETGCWRTARRGPARRRTPSRRKPSARRRRGRRAVGASRERRPSRCAAV